MNVAEYGQNLRKIADRNLQDLATLDRERQVAKWKNDLQQDVAEAQTIGGLMGTVVGAGKGIYTNRKDAHERTQDDAYNTWQMKAFQTALKDPNAPIPPPPERTDYSFLDDIETAFDWRHV